MTITATITSHTRGGTFLVSFFHGFSRGAVSSRRWPLLSLMARLPGFGPSTAGRRQRRRRRDRRPVGKNVRRRDLQVNMRSGWGRVVGHPEQPGDGGGDHDEGDDQQRQPPLAPSGPRRHGSVL